MHRHFYWLFLFSQLLQPQELQHLYKMYPYLPKKFKVPEGVYNMKNGVRTELYTDISPLPATTKSETNPYGDVDPF